MKKLKKLTTLLALSLTLTLVMPNVLPFAQTMQTAEASTIKINKKTVSLKVGKTIGLKISGTNKKVTWKSAKKAVATVSSTGKVTAKSSGNTTITATANGKKYTCKVKVTKTVNKYVENAPFKAKEAKMGKVKFIMPKNWDLKVTKDSGADIGDLYPSFTLTDSGIVLILNPTGAKKPKYEYAKREFIKFYTEEYIKKQWEEPSFDVTVTNKKVSELKTKHGTVLKLTYDLTTIEKSPESVTGASVTTEEKTSYKYSIYCLYIDNYYFKVTSFDADDADMDSIAGYIMKTFTVDK